MSRKSLACLLLVSMATTLALAGCASDRPRSLETVRTVGDRAYDRGEYQTALIEYSEVVDRAPADWRYRVNLGKTLLILERPRAAREHLAVAHNLRPNDERIVDLFAQSMLEADDHDDLFSFLRQRVEQRRDVANYLRLGHFALRAGDADEAERALLTAARIDMGRTIEPQLALAELYAHIGDDERALRRLRMALSFDLNNEEVRQRIRAYGKIPGPSFVIVPDEAR